MISALLKLMRAAMRVTSGLSDYDAGKPSHYKTNSKHWFTTGAGKQCSVCTKHTLQALVYGGGDSSVVRAPDSWLKGRGFKSLLERRENFLLQGRLSVLTLISVSVPPPVTTVARKKSRSFCQKCRWQVTAKHAYTLRMWILLNRASALVTTCP